jgi:hypothetical protein
MPFESPAQEAKFFADPKLREIGKRWKKKYGDAPGWHQYLKKRKKKKKSSSEVAADSKKIAQILSSLGCHDLADSLRKCMSRLNNGMTRSS